MPSPGPTSNAVLRVAINIATAGVLLHARRMVWEEAMCVANSEQARGDSQAAAEPENFSAFAARVLNQLSLSAWLPGAFFILSAALLLWFRLRGSVNVLALGPFVQENWGAVLILAVPSLVVTTLLTQAFSFDAIRLLEGYWSRRGPSSWLMRFLIMRKRRRRKSLQVREKAAWERAFSRARPRLITEVSHGLVLLAVEADVTHADRPEGLSEEQHEEADDLPWTDFCEPWDAARLSQLRREVGEFSEDSRVMPTKLGNILRSAEDQLENTGGDLEGFVMRHREFVPSRVLLHHDQFRTRLDMYCTLVFVATSLGIASIPILWELPDLNRVLVPLAFIVTARASYGAALSSARGYGTALRQIDTSVSEYAAAKL